MFFIKYEDTIIPSTGISKITADDSTSGKSCINIFTNADYIINIFVKDPQKVLDELLMQMAEIEARCVGNIINIPRDSWATVELKQVQPDDLIIKFSKEEKTNSQET